VDRGASWLFISSDWSSLKRVCTDSGSGKNISLRFQAISCSDTSRIDFDPVNHSIYHFALSNSFDLTLFTLFHLRADRNVFWANQIILLDQQFMQKMQKIQLISGYAYMPNWRQVYCIWDRSWSCSTIFTNSHAGFPDKQTSLLCFLVG
jgi:hypothetical protein